MRFLQSYFSVIAEAPLQIYCCLAFAPRKSVVRRTFEDAIPRWISNLPKVEENWDACLLTLEGHSSSVYSVVFSHDSKKVASASGDKTIRIWDAETGECERELKGHSSYISSVVFSHDSKKVASGSDDETIRIWNAETGECERELKGHISNVNSVVFSHDLKKVASSYDDGTIRIWNAETGECGDLVSLHGYAGVLSFTLDGRGIVTDCGTFPLTCSSQSRPGSAMPWQSSHAPMLACTDSTWVTAAGKDLLWLPPECRGGKVAVSGSRVVIGCLSGRVLVLGISMADMEQWMDTTNVHDKRVQQTSECNKKSRNLHLLNLIN
jgi:WD40 repeat protein